MFDWDEANISHIARHNITPEEVEQVLVNDPVDLGEQSENTERKFIQVGLTQEARCLAVVTTWRRDRLRVVTAYDAPRWMQKLYVAEKRQQG